MCGDPERPRLRCWRGNLIVKRVRVTVVVSHPIQYFSPLFDLLQARGKVDLTVCYTTDAGARAVWDEGFAAEVEWDIPLTAGHRAVLLTTIGARRIPAWVRGGYRLMRVIQQSDAVVIHGYRNAEAVLAICFCTILRVPYLLRADTSFRAKRRRIDPRYWWPRLAGRGSAGALAIGERNAQAMADLGCRPISPAPFAVDNERFHAAANVVRRDLGSVRAEFGLPLDRTIVAFAGKFSPHKRAEDVLAAARHVESPIHVLMIGDGPARASLKAAARGLPVTFAGLLNQREMPRALAAADVLVLPSSYEPWGLVVNEALACGCVPVVSSAVGCGPDLVAGHGELYPTGDVEELARAIERAVRTASRPGRHEAMLAAVAPYDLDRCASGYESALHQVVSARGR